MNDIDVYAIISFVMVILLVLFYYNFMSILKFKWILDYMKTEENVCYESNGAKYEGDTKKHKMAKFLYDKLFEISYFSLKDDFTKSFYVYVTFYSIICIALLISFYPYIFTMYKFYLILFIIYVSYTTVNSLIVKNFQDIDFKRNEDDGYIRQYYKLYKIINALLIVANIYDEPMEYMYDKLNYKQRTFDDMLKKHISSHFNLSNTSNILQYKTKLINDLDIAQVFVFDKLSPYYLKYFDNIYLINTTNDNIEDKIYLRDIFSYRNSSVNFHKVRVEFDLLNKLITEYDENSESIPIETNSTYKKIQEVIENYPPDALDIETQYNNLWDILRNINVIIDNDKQLSAFNSVLFTKVMNQINSIKRSLYSQKNNEVYNEINVKIKELLKKEAIDVEEDDYIKFFFRHQDLIMNMDDNNAFKIYSDVFNLLTYQSEYVYAYIVFCTIILLSIMHYIYVSFDNYTYLSAMSLMILIFGFTMYFKTTLNK